MNLQNQVACDSDLVALSYAHFCSGTSFLGPTGTTALSRTASLICFRGRAPTLHRALGIDKSPCIPVNSLHFDKIIMGAKVWLCMELPRALPQGSGGRRPWTPL